MITPLPSSGKTSLKPGFPQLPFFGVDPVLTEEADGVRPFHPLPGNTLYNLCNWFLHRVRS